MTKHSSAQIQDSRAAPNMANLPVTGNATAWVAKRLSSALKENGLASEVGSGLTRGVIHWNARVPIAP